MLNKENIISKRFDLSYEKIASNKIIWRLSFLIIVVCLISKIFLCSVSLFGEEITNLMTADYWNFGKELLGGKILYKDIIDHKGLYIFLLYSGMVFISNNNILILILFESLLYLATVVAFYWYMKDIEIGSQNSNKRIVALFPTCFFAISYLILTLNVTLVNTEGISAFCIILIYGIIKKQRKVTPKMFFIIGFILGILFNFKITAIIPYIPLFLYACFNHIKYTKQYKTLFKSIFVGLFSFVITNVPFLFYLIKNSCLNEFVTYYKYACAERNNQMFYYVLVFIIVLFVGIFFSYVGYDIIRDLSICVATLLISIAVGDDASYYIAFYVVIIFIELFRYNQMNFQITLVAIMAIVLFSVREVYSNIVLKELSNTKKIAETYNITNENILYICEDFGYGVYSDELFKEPYQWIPTKFFGSDEFTEYYTELTIERLKNKEFEYVFAPTLGKFEEIKENIKIKETDKHYRNNSNKMLATIYPYLEENYSNELLKEGYLYKAK